MSLSQKLLRRKPLGHEHSLGTELKRVLTLVDLIFVGIGATLGTGVYTLLGVIAHESTGPSIVISFFLAGLASILSALCYSEFAARVPRAGSVYEYSFVTMGEGMAWFAGWQLLLEYIIGTSAVAKGLVNYLNALANNRIHEAMLNNLGWNLSSELSPYPDFVSAGFILLLTLVVMCGVKESATMNNTLTGLNCCVILFTVILGSFYADTTNFTANFSPYGVRGVFEGAAISFFCYVGFDAIATTAEEAKNPKRDLPLAIVSSLCICCVGYMASGLIISMLQPYNQIDVNAPLATAFSAHNVHWAKNVIAVGAVCGCFSSLLMGVVPMPRIAYAIASDGLLPKMFSKVHPRFRTPHVSAWATGLLAALLAMIFPYVSLANLMSLGTLMCYAAVCASVLVLRYREYDEECAAGPTKPSDPSKARSAVDPHTRAQLSRIEDPNAWVPFAGSALPAVDRARGGVRLWGWPTSSYAASCVLITLYTGAAVVVCVVYVCYGDSAGRAFYSVLGVGLAVMVYCTALLALLPQRVSEKMSFCVPWSPYIPLLAMLFNVFLLINLPWSTWVRFSVWCVIGFVLYVFYGIKNSVIAHPEDLTP